MLRNYGVTTAECDIFRQFGGDWFPDTFLRKRTVTRVLCKWNGYHMVSRKDTPLSADLNDPSKPNKVYPSIYVFFYKICRLSHVLYIIITVLTFYICIELYFFTHLLSYLYLLI